jgi:hypothetical protein
MNIEPDDPLNIHINGLGRVLKGDLIDVRVQIAQNLFLVKNGEMSPSTFYKELAKMDMPEHMEPRHMLNQVKKDIFDYGGERGRQYFFGTLYAEGGSLVEKTLLDWRRQVVFDAVDEVMVRFRGRNVANGEKFNAYLAEVGSWTTEKLTEMRFAGDIDFSFVAGDIELAREMKAEYDKIIFDRLQMSAEHADIPCTAHGMASAEVYMGKHGQLSGEGFMKMHKKGLLELDFENGKRTNKWIPAEKVLQDLAIEAKAARLPLMAVDPKWKTEPGISLEMIRHFEHDIILKNVYTDIDAFLKAAKYLERSTDARFGKGADLKDPLVVFARELMRLKKEGSPAEIARYVLDNFEKVTGKPFPAVELGPANQEGLSKTQIADRDGAIKQFWDQCREQMWKNTVAGFDKELKNVRQFMQEATDEESAKRANAELYELREMMEVEWRIVTDQEVGVKSMPQEFKNMMHEFRGEVKDFHARLGSSDWGVKVMDVESQKVYRLVDQMLRTETESHAGKQFSAAALLHAPHFVNSYLDFIDDRLLGKLRGQEMDMHSFLDKELELDWQRKAESFLDIDRGVKAKINAHAEQGRAMMTRLSEQMTTEFGAKLTAGIQKINRSFDLQSSRAGSAAMTGLVAVNLAQEIPVYIDLFYREGVLKGNWEDLVVEFFRRRVPFVSTTEYVVYGWWGLATWDFFVTLVPPLGLANVAVHLSSAAFTWSLELYLSSELELFIDTLYDDAIFAAKLEEVPGGGVESTTRYDSGAVLGNWTLHKLVYRGNEIEVKPYLAEKEKNVRALLDYVKQPYGQREGLPPELILLDPLTSWTREDEVLRQNLANLDPWLVMIDEMKKNPHVGEKLFDHLGDLWIARWEQIKLEFIRRTVKQLEDRRAGEQAAGSGQLPLMIKEVNRLGVELAVIEQLNASLEAEMGGTAWEFYRAFRDWFMGQKRAIFAQPDIETYLVESGRIVNSYLKTYTAILAARQKAESGFVLGSPVDDGLRILTGPHFLSGNAGADGSDYKRWEGLPGVTEQAIKKELLAIKRKYLPDSSLETAPDSFDRKTLILVENHDVWRELWKYVQSQGIVQEETEFTELSTEAFVNAFIPASIREELSDIMATLSSKKPDPVERHRFHTMQRRYLVERFEEHYRNPSAEADTGTDYDNLPETAYFKVLVQGAGYTATYGDGTYDISGSEERFFIVNRGESAAEKLEAMRAYIEGDPCERTWAGPAGDGMAPPNLFISGPQVTIIDGPYFSYSEFFDTVEFAKNWQLNGKNGPHPMKLKEMACR